MGKHMKLDLVIMARPVLNMASMKLSFDGYDKTYKNFDKNKHIEYY